MALTYVFAVKPPAAVGSSIGLSSSGPLVHSYIPNAAGIITGVTPADALFMNVNSGTALAKLCATGATADRPLPGGTLAAAGVNYTNPAPAFGDAFYDTTLSKVVFYVGSTSSTGWVDITGAAV